MLRDAVPCLTQSISATHAADTYMAAVVDVADEAEVAAWMQAIHARFGRLDGLVNNAAAFIFGTF